MIYVLTCNMPSTGKQLIMADFNKEAMEEEMRKYKEVSGIDHDVVTWKVEEIQLMPLPPGNIEIAKETKSILDMIKEIKDMVSNLQERK